MKFSILFIIITLVFLVSSASAKEEILKQDFPYLKDTDTAWIDSGTDIHSGHSSYHDGSTDYRHPDEYPHSYSHHHIPHYYLPWLSRIQEWEWEINEIRGFGAFLTHLELTSEQIENLNEITEFAEEEIQQLTLDYDVVDTRREFFEAFTEDFFMELDMYSIWSSMNWYESDMKDIVAVAIEEIHDLLTEEQLQLGRAIINRVQDFSPANETWFSPWSYEPAPVPSATGLSRRKY